MLIHWPWHLVFWPKEGRSPAASKLRWRGWRVDGKPLVECLKETLSSSIPQREYNPDGDGEGTRIRYPSQCGSIGSWSWRPPDIAPEDRCPSEECLFGREWIQCKKRRGHKGVHRNCETWAWDEGDERV